MGEATRIREGDDVRVGSAAAAIASGEVWQIRDGRAGYLPDAEGRIASQSAMFKASGIVSLPKTTSMVLLDGGRAYWDHSANAVMYKKVDDRDFYLGRVVGDWASGDTTCTVNLGIDPSYDLDLVRDPYTTVPVGTQALGGFLPPQRNGGALTLLLSATNEAQKADALSKDGFAAGGAKAVIEGAFNLISQGAGGAPDFNIGIASATNATDADSIAQYLFLHMDGNSLVINAQSKDGTTTVAAVSTTVSAVAGAGNANRVEFWFDLRDMTSAKLYVNAVRVNSGTTFNVAAAAARWLLLAHLEKTAATDQFSVDVEWLRARYGQQ